MQRQRIMVAIQFTRSKHNITMHPSAIIIITHDSPRLFVLFLIFNFFFFIIIFIFLPLLHTLQLMRTTTAAHCSFTKTYYCIIKKSII